MKPLFLVAALVACTVQIEAPLHADDGRPHFAVIDWFPFGYVDGGTQKGLFVEIAGEIDKALSSNGEVVIAPITRVFRGLDKGEFDFTFSYRSEAYDEHLDYVLDLGCLRPAIISMKTAPINSVPELNGRRIVYPPVGDFVRRVLPTISADGVAVPNTQVMFKMALRGRLDAFVINDAIWQAYRHNRLPGFQVPNDRWGDFHEPFFLEMQHMAVSVSPKSNHQEMALQMRTLMKNEGFVNALQAIYSRYKIPQAMRCLHAGNSLDAIR